MAEVNRPPGTGSRGRGTRPGMWWVRPAFGAISLGLGAFLSRVFNWLLHDGEAPTAGELAELILFGVICGLLWGFGANWVASWGRAK